MLMRELHSPTQLDEHGIKRALQATIDHYPRLIALRITLRLPDPSTQPLDTLTTRFYAALLQRINVFLNSRQLAGKPTPPTQISLLWGTEGDGGIPMLLLFNQDTFYSMRRYRRKFVLLTPSSAKPGHQLSARLTSGCSFCCRKPFASGLLVVNPIPIHPSMLRLATTRCSYLYLTNQQSLTIYVTPLVDLISLTSLR
ncbi:TPA: inovirus-type Gp2 protein [Serratia fonticola]